MAADWFARVSRDLPGGSEWSVIVPAVGVGRRVDGIDEQLGLVDVQPPIESCDRENMYGSRTDRDLRARPS